MKKLMIYYSIIIIIIIIIHRARRITVLAMKNSSYGLHQSVGSAVLHDQHNDAEIDSSRSSQDILIGPQASKMLARGLRPNLKTDANIINCAIE